MYYMDIFSVNKRIHFIGIGGISMSGIAKFFLANGYTVSGSERESSAVTTKLKNLGAKIYIGHKKENVVGADVVVYTSAISDENPEIKEAIKRKIKILKRSEVLGAILKRYNKSVGIAGCHGKTTATAMLTHILSDSDINAAAFIGGDDLTFGNYKSGKDICVAEACEYKKNFLDLNPTISVILNVDCDHMESYGSFENLLSAFKQFSQSEYSVINADDENCVKIIGDETLTFGIKNSADYTAENVTEGENGYSFTAFKRGKKLGDVTLSVKGYHNVYNALAAIACADILGVKFDTENLRKFKGVARRQEFLGKVKGVKVFADYAHHPTEITETLKAFNVSDSDLVVFQPHTYSRTRLLAEEFVAALKTVKNLLIYKTFPAREKFNIDGDAFTLYKMIKGVNCGVKFAADYKDLSKKVNLYSAKKEKSRRIIVLGAGDVYYDAKKIIIENACQSR